MSKLALKNDWPSDAELSTLSESVEQAAWRDAMQAAPAWMLSNCSIHALDIGDALLLASRDSHSLMFNRVIGVGERTPATEETIGNIMDRYWQIGCLTISFMPVPTRAPRASGASCSSTA